MEAEAKKLKLQLKKKLTKKELLRYEGERQKSKITTFFQKAGGDQGPGKGRKSFPKDGVANNSRIKTSSFLTAGLNIGPGKSLKLFPKDGAKANSDLKTSSFCKAGLDMEEPMEIDQDELDPNMIDSMEVDALSWEVRDKIELAREKAMRLRRASYRRE